MSKINHLYNEKRLRLDLTLLNIGLSESRTKAIDLIKEGKVFVNSKIIKKTSYLVKKEDKIYIEKEFRQWVSRGSIKLLFAIEKFDLDIKGKIVYDIGASTGGFTEVCLEKGARLVYSIDVGTNQLHKKLKNDKRVFDLSSTDIRSITEINLPPPQLLVVDLSFISITKALTLVMSKVPSNTEMICLIKPQFELSKKQLNKNGVVKEDKFIEDVILKIKYFVKKIGWHFIDIKESPILGRSGNKEFLLYANKDR